MKQVIEKLGIEKENYEYMIFCFYARWCEGVTSNTRNYQEVLANSAINRWFLIELSKLEVEFITLSNQYPNADAKDLQALYSDCTIDMYKIKPSALLNQIITKKSNPEGQEAFEQLKRN